jgi:hypothetical protein
MDDRIVAIARGARKARFLKIPAAGLGQHFNIVNIDGISIQRMQVSEDQRDD